MHQSPNLPKFVTLGPTGTNHEMVTQQYLSFHGLDGAAIALVKNFRQGLDLIDRGAADFMVQCAVHRACTETVATAHFEYGIHIVDTFISPSKPLGILTRIDIDHPKTLALQAATQQYARLERWPELIDVPSIVDAAISLLEGRTDSALTMLELADQHPGRFRVDVDIGTVDDPWLVFGKQRVSSGKLLAWPNSPAAGLFFGAGL